MHPPGHDLGRGTYTRRCDAAGAHGLRHQHETIGGTDGEGRRTCQWWVWRFDHETPYLDALIDDSNRPLSTFIWRYRTAYRGPGVYAVVPNALRRPSSASLTLDLDITEHQGEFIGMPLAVSTGLYRRSRAIGVRTSYPWLPEGVGRMGCIGRFLRPLEPAGAARSVRVSQRRESASLLVTGRRAKVVGDGGAGAAPTTGVVPRKWGQLHGLGALRTSRADRVEPAWVTGPAYA